MNWWNQPGKKRRSRLSRSKARRSFHLTDNLVESLEPRTLLAATLLADINTAPVYPDNMTFVNTAAGPRYFYTTQNSGGGNDLYVTQIDGNGTASGTTLLRSFPAPQQTTYLPERAMTDLAGAGQLLYFSANDGTNGKELWKSDGTAGGTVLVKNINTTPGTGSYPTYMTDFNGTLFFSANNGTQGIELWKSDGTNAGTTMVSDIVPGISDSVPANLTPIPGGPSPRMIFTARFPGSGSTQIVYSTTDGKTVAPVDFTPGVTDDKFLFVDPLAVPFGKDTMRLPIVGNSVLVAGNDFATGDIAADQDLWITDGTGAGSSRVVNLPNNSIIRELTGVTNGAFFTLTNRANGNVDLYKSNGTGGGTSLLGNLAPSGSTDFADTFVGTGTRLFYQLHKPSQDKVELWTTQLSASGVTKVLDIRPGEAEPNARYPYTGQAVGQNGTLYFTNIDSTNGMELWKSNGTPGGTSLVKDVLPGTVGSKPRNLAVVNGQILFAARGAGGAAQLWRSNGSTGGTTSVLNLPVNTSESSNSQFAVRYGSMVLFAAADGALGSELWKTDGTTGGTVLVKDIRSNGGSVPQSGINYKNEVYFLVLGTDQVAGLWKTNGTEAGTQLVRNITTLNSFSTSLVVYRNQLVFASLNPANSQVQLWMSNGTTGGTNPVASFNNGQTTNEIRELVVAGDPATSQDRLYFAVDNGANGKELWSFIVNTNGTSPTVNLVSDINTSGGSNPRSLVAFNNRLFFAANDGKTGEELWTTRGTSATTSRVMDIEPGAASSSPGELTVAGSLLYFAATTGASGRELYYTAGTSVVRATQIAPGSSSSSPLQLRNVNGTIVFSAIAAATGRELYRYDRGAGPQLLKDINPGPSTGVTGGFPTLSAGNLLYFTGTSAANGAELWSTDGTVAGTKLVHDFKPGANSSNPRALVQLSSGNIMVAADNGLLGSEPYVVPAGTAAFKPLNDFNGDGKSDYAVYRPDLPTVDPKFNPARPDLSYWYTILNQGDTSATVFDWERQWGLKGDIPVAGDFDGDGNTDYTVYRTADKPEYGATRGWYIALNRAGQSVQAVFSQSGGWPIIYGLPDDIPVPGDYNGDGRADIALYRPSTGRFYVQLLDIVTQGNGLVAQQSTLVEGLPIWDPNGVALTGGSPVSGDFNGDGRTDFAVYQTSGTQGTWYVRLNLPNGTYPYTFQEWGRTGDIPIAGDFNGDGRTDFTVYRPTGDGNLMFDNRFVSQWFPLLNLNLQVSSSPSSQISNTVQPQDAGRRHGFEGDTPVTGDYNGDGKDDYAVYRTDNIPQDTIIFQGREVSRWYVVINGGTTWDWGRPHGYSEDISIGRSPLLSRSTFPTGNGGPLATLPVNPGGPGLSSSSIKTASVLDGIALAPTPSVGLTTTDPFNIIKKRKLRF